LDFQLTQKKSFDKGNLRNIPTQWVQRIFFKYLSHIGILKLYSVVGGHLDKNK